MGLAPLSFWARLWLAFILPWKILVNSQLAARVMASVRGQPVPSVLSEAEAKPLESAPSAPTVEVQVPTTALQLLSILQREGRFVDFLQEDIQAYADADVGAAARVVHAGCKKAMNEYLVLEAVRPEAEGEAVVLEQGFDPVRHRVTGNVVGQPPFRGRLAHHGWQVTQIRLPKLIDGRDPTVVAPAEVEL